MKLTKHIREAFVRAAMQDVPKPVDFEAQAHKLCIEDSIMQLPPKLQAIARDNSLNYCLSMDTYWFPRQPFHGVYVYEPRGTSYTPSPEVFKTVLELSGKKRAEDEARSALKEKLMAAAMSCTTRKALANLLPEFEQYLPEDTPAAARSLPAIANIVADFSKAGWPKDKTKEKTNA